MLPVQALIDALGIVERPTMRDDGRAQTTGVARQLAETLGLPRENVSAVLRDGGMLTVYRADRWAVRAGLHPAEVWGDEFYKAKGAA